VPFTLDTMLHDVIIDICVDNRRSLCTWWPERRGNTLALFCEMDGTMPLTRNQAIADLLERLDSGVPRWLVALAGVPGSGKSTAAARLAEEVNHARGPNTLVALGMDGFHLTRAELRRMPDPALAFARRGAPWTFDTRALEQRLLRVRAGAGREDVEWPGFEHNVGDPIEGVFTVPAGTRLVIVEGLYLLHQADGWEAISGLFDERWFLDTPLELALDRLALRHMQAWDMTRAAADARIASSDRLNAELVLGTSRYADRRLILEN
jgi:pantothenate kinase